LPGIGDWTAQYIALRALHEPDAFPASDVGLLRAMDESLGKRATPDDLLAMAQSWRPWRAYAAQHLWTADATPVVRKKAA
jgi:AraC family transcriptional regulator of adaptative response / DNA-3-methyladenine glycosylase II